jgi:hypothetical protein
MIRRLLCVAAFLASVSIAGAAPWNAGPGEIFNPGTAYTGPCDLTTCAEAWSVTRGMIASYSGNLFEIVRDSDHTTLQVGQSSHHADLSGVYSFCVGANCYVSKIYGQINSNTLIYINSTMANGAPPYPTLCNNTTYGCASPFLLDPDYGTPVIRTTYPSGFALVNDGSLTGVNGGTNPLSIWQYGRNEGWTTCCGTFGLSHAFAEADTVGSFFGQWLSYGNTPNTFFACSAATALCSGISEESADRDGADYTPSSTQDAVQLITWDGAAGTNTVKVYANSATAIFSGSPPCSEKNSGNCVYGVHPLNIGKHFHFGNGGDGSTVDRTWREGLIVNGTLAGTDFTNLNTNVSAFYAASAPTCKSTADLGWGWSTIGASSYDAAPFSTEFAWALRNMRADYYGPIADLRDAVGTTHTYSRTSGCVIDTAAATFCATNPPCTVSKLYNQGTFSGAGNASAHDPNLDMVQATVATQPSGTFSSLNGLPTMHFSGAQRLCTANIGNPFGGGTFGVGVLALVGKRTGNTTSYSEGLSQYPTTNTILGWNNAASQIETFSPTVASGGTTYTDSHWHSIIAEMNNETSTATLYGNNTSAGTAASTSIWSLSATGKVCIGAASDGTQPLIGDIAEASIHVNQAPGGTVNQKTGYAAQHTAIFNAHQAAWGTLPN